MSHTENQQVRLKIFQFSPSTTPAEIRNHCIVFSEGPDLSTAVMEAIMAHPSRSGSVFLSHGPSGIKIKCVERSERNTR